MSNQIFITFKFNLSLQINKNMEVHHHPDLHHRKKKFKEYVLECLMIFLAVTLGFFCGNDQRTYF